MTTNEIIDLVEENQKSVEKYGNWDGMTFRQMSKVLKREMRELNAAIVFKAIDGDHGIYCEAIQVANCAMKIAVQARKRKHEPKI